MLQRVKKFAVRLHRDESGPNTVEWILLIIIALVILVAIYAFARWALEKFGQQSQKLKDDDNPFTG